MTEPHVGYSNDQTARAVPDTELDTTPTNAVVIDAGRCDGRRGRAVSAEWTHRVVVVRSDRPGVFCGASGVYDSSTAAKAEMWDIARSWVGLAATLLLNHDGSFVVGYHGITHTYSILTEQAAA